jgi:hypothetical protein
MAVDIVLDMKKNKTDPPALRSQPQRAEEKIIKEDTGSLRWKERKMSDLKNTCRGIGNVVEK